MAIRKEHQQLAGALIVAVLIGLAIWYYLKRKKEGKPIIPDLFHFNKAAQTKLPNAWDRPKPGTNSFEKRNDNVLEKINQTGQSLGDAIASGLKL